MVALRALFILIALVAFFLIGTPLQWLIAQVAPGAAHRVPNFFCRSLLRLLKVRLTVEGAMVEDHPVLMAANHVSWIDVLALGAIRPFCFLAKSEVSRWPVLSAFATVQGTVFVDRKRRRSILPANRLMAARMLEGRAVLLFPEGTTVDAAEPGPFRSSHFAAARGLLRLAPERGVVVQPVALAYSTSAAAWVGDDDLLSHVWRTLRAPPLTCRIVFTSPIECGLGSDRKQIARQSRQAVIEVLGRKRCAVEHAAPPVGDVDLGQAQASGC